MRDYSSQREEIETIKPRTITVNLSDADVRRLAEKSGEGGLTISELLENFIGDLVDGTYSNGSDERMYAEQWYQRCWFAMFSDDTFLKFLLLWGDLDAYIDLMDELESNKKEMAEMTADAEEYSSEERDELQEYINDLQKEKDYYWNKFWNENAKKNPMFLKKKLKILWRGNRSLTHYLTPKICRSTLLASRGKLYTLGVKYSPYTCYSKHRENIDTRAIFPLVSRYTGALPPNTPSHNILQKGKTIVPQTAQQK